MKSRRKLVGATAALLLLMAACGGDGSETTTGSDSAAPLPDPDSVGDPLPDSIQAAGDYRIGMSYPFIHIPYFVAVSYGAAQECDRLGIECLLTYGEVGRPEVQVQEIEELLAQDLDGLTVTPADEQSVVPVLERAIDDGIVVTSFGQPMGGLEHYGNESVDQYDKGVQITNSLLECLREEKGLEEGEILGIGGERGAGYYTPVEQAYEDILGTGENAGFEMVFHQYTNQTREDALRVTEDALTAHPQPDGMVSGAPEIGQGAIQALKERGFGPGDVCHTTGGGWDVASEKAIRDGWYYSFTVEPGVNTGIQAIRKVVAHLNGEEVPYFIKGEIPLVTADNIDELQARLDEFIPPEGFTPPARAGG